MTLDFLGLTLEYSANCSKSVINYQSPETSCTVRTLCMDSLDGVNQVSSSSVPFFRHSIVIHKPRGNESYHTIFETVSWNASAYYCNGIIVGTFGLQLNGWEM